MPIRTIDPNQIAGPVRTIDPSDIAGPSTTSPGAVASQPGFLQRLGQAFGVPTSEADAKQMNQQSQPINFSGYPVASKVASAIAGPAGTAGKMAFDYGKNLIDQGKNTVDAFQHPSVDENGYDSRAKAVKDLALRGVLSPVGGEGVANLADDAQAGNLEGAGGDFLGTLGNLMLLEHGREPSPMKRIQKLSFAAGPGETQHVAQTLRDLHGAAGSEPVRTVDDFKRVTKDAKNNLRDQYGNALGPVANNPAYAGDVAQRIRDLIKPNMDLTADGRAAKNAINKAAIEFETPGWTLGKLDAERMDRNANLTSHLKKSPLARYTGEMGNTNTAIDQAAADAIRDHVYPQVDAAVGKPAGYFADLKRRHGALMNLEDTLGKRVKELEDQQTRAAGAPRTGRSRVMHGAVYGPAHAAVGVADALIKPKPLKEANAAVRTGFDSSRGPVTGAIKAANRVNVGTLPARYLMMLPQEEQDQQAAQALPAGHPLAQIQ